MSDNLSAIELNRVERDIRASEVVKDKHVLLQTSAARRLYDMAQPNVNDPRVTKLEAENDGCGMSWRCGRAGERDNVPRLDTRGRENVMAKKTKQKQRTAQQIVDDANELAILFYRMHGYQVPATYRMYEATHPQELGMWNLAVLAYEHIQGTEVREALNELEDEA